MGPEVIEKECPDWGRNCMRVEDEHVVIFAQEPFHRHELAHAVHRSVWPRRQPVLHEGLANVFIDELPFMAFPPQFSSAEIDAAIEATSARDGR